MDLKKSSKKYLFMSHLKAETDRLLVSDPDKSRSTCHIFISHPSPLEEKSLGKLFLICEIDSQDKINAEIISIIQEEIKNNFYYSNETNIETAFENALQKTNESLHHLISEGVTHWLDKFNIIIAVLRGADLFLAHVGRMHAFLIHQHKIIDILGGAATSRNEVNPLKIFSSVVSGSLNPDDQILFCTPSLLDYFSQEKLKRVIAENLPSESTKQLERVLIDASPLSSFGAIVIKLIPQKEPEITEFRQKQVIPTSFSPPQSSMDELIDKEKRTSEYLSPSILPNITKSLGNLFRRANLFIRSKILKKPPRRRAPDTYYQPIRKERSWAKELFSQIIKDTKRIFNYLFTALRRLGWLGANTFRRRGEIKSRLKELPQETEQKIHGQVFQFRRLNRRTKMALLAAFAALFVFATSIVILGLRQDVKLSKQEKEELIEIIKDKTFEAGAALSYEDERGAKNLLAEARDLLKKLPSRSKEDKKIVSELEAGINEQYDKTKHIVNIADPLLKKDLKELSEQAAFSGPVQTGDYLYTFNSNNEIIRLNLNDGEATTLENPLSEIGQFITDLKETGNVILLYHDKKGVVEYNTLTEKFTPLAISFPEDFKGLSDWAVYRSRLYVLDASGNEIYRFQRGTAGFGPATTWIQDPNLNITGAASLSIDGSIYLLESSGRLLELFQGRELEFSLDTIDPNLQSASKIWTEEDSNYLYILDPKEKRLVQFNKKGELKNQYYSDKFNDLKGFTISETDQKAWLLAGSQIFEITLSL